jgi:hypothetical protein
MNLALALLLSSTRDATPAAKRRASHDQHEAISHSPFIGRAVSCKPLRSGDQ